MSSLSSSAISTGPANGAPPIPPVPGAAASASSRAPPPAHTSPPSSTQPRADAPDPAPRSTDAPPAGSRPCSRRTAQPAVLGDADAARLGSLHASAGPDAAGGGCQTGVPCGDTSA